MDLRLNATETAFRDRLLSWLGAVEVPPGLRDYGATPTDSDVPSARQWQRMLFDGGWAGLSWPIEYGGQGATIFEQAIYTEELARARLPRQLNLVGLDLVGPMIVAFGTSAQRDRFLGPLLRGDEVWCQLFSEPNAGSDLAALQTAVRRTGKGWAVSGQKVWTSGAHYADFGLLLARTDPDASSHAGISCFLLPMGRAGMDVRPLRQMNGETKFNEVFFDEVEVGPEDMLGPAEHGWQVATSTLGRERLTIGAQAIGLLQWLDELRPRTVGGNHLARTVVNDRWTSLWCRARLLRLTWLRAMSVTGGGQAPTDSSMSILKLAGTELQGAIARLAGDVLGADITAGDAGATWRDRLLVSPGATLAGGTSEVQRTILGERVLGLPRAPW